jgi:hypothetical protein
LLPSQLLLVPSATVVSNVSGIPQLLASLLLLVSLLLLAHCHIVGTPVFAGVHAVVNFPAVATLLLLLSIN